MRVGVEIEHWKGGRMHGMGRRHAVRQTLATIEQSMTIDPARAYHESYLRGELSVIEPIIGDLRRNLARDGEVALAVDLLTDARALLHRLEGHRRDLGRKHPGSPLDHPRPVMESFGHADGQLAIVREYVGRLERWVEGDASLIKGGAPERSDLQ